MDRGHLANDKGSYSRMKPVAKAPMNCALSATFSEIPCWMRSTHQINQQAERLRKGEERTSIGLNARGDFSRPESVEKCNILAQHSLEIFLANATGITLPCPCPLYVHTDESRSRRKMTGSTHDDHVQISGEKASEANDDEPKGVKGGLVPEIRLRGCKGSTLVRSRSAVFDWLG